MPMSASATTMSGRRDEFQSSHMKKPILTPQVSISAATTASHDRPIPIRNPGKMQGPAQHRYDVAVVRGDVANTNRRVD